MFGIEGREFSSGLENLVVAFGVLFTGEEVDIIGFVFFPEFGLVFVGGRRESL